MALKFGTSGLRGLAVEIVGEASRRYTRAFASVLAARSGGAPGRLLVGRDLRDSSPAITRSVLAAAQAAGMETTYCGRLPTPALALEAQRLGAAAIMVTGSHIPANQNGLKFYDSAGEIDKPTELAIVAALDGLDPRDINEPELPEADPAPLARYAERYAGMLETPGLRGMRIGVWQHSSVARDLFAETLARSGAEVVPLGRVDVFVPIDTEAVSAEDGARMRAWVREHRLDAVISTDGDADRPLVADETGAFLRGDLVGLLTARYVGADAVVTPVSSNSAIEETGFFPTVVRTRIGSPYVIAGIAEALTNGSACVVGFEANGGVLLGSPVSRPGIGLEALPTRDALLPILAVLCMAAEQGISLSALAATVPARAAESGRLQEVPLERSADFMRLLADRSYANSYFAPIGSVLAVSTIDGFRFSLSGNATVHYRPSGNAPELRCYTEAPDAAAAARLLKWGLDRAEAIVRA